MSRFEFLREEDVDRHHPISKARSKRFVFNQVGKVVAQCGSATRLTRHHRNILIKIRFQPKCCKRTIFLCLAKETVGYPRPLTATHIRQDYLVAASFEKLNGRNSDRRFVKIQIRISKQHNFFSGSRLTAFVLFEPFVKGLGRIFGKYSTRIESREALYNC